MPNWHPTWHPHPRFHYRKSRIRREQKPAFVWLITRPTRESGAITCLSFFQYVSTRRGNGKPHALNRPSPAYLPRHQLKMPASSRLQACPCLKRAKPEYRRAVASGSPVRQRGPVTFLGAFFLLPPSPPTGTPIWLDYKCPSCGDHWRRFLVVMVPRAGTMIGRMVPRAGTSGPSCGDR